MATVREIVEQAAGGQSVWAAVEDLKAGVSKAAADAALGAVVRAGLAQRGDVDGFGAYDATVGGNFGLRVFGAENQPIYLHVDWVVNRKEAQVEVSRDAMNPKQAWTRSYTLRSRMATPEAIGGLVATAMDQAAKAT